MATSNASVHVSLSKDNVPEAKMVLEYIERYNNTQLTLLLQCRGLAVSGNRAEFIKKDTCGVPGDSVVICTL